MAFDEATWRKSSRSAPSGGACVEVAVTTAAVGIRDSKNPAQGHHTLNNTQWTSFLTNLKNGTFDLH